MGSSTDMLRGGDMGAIGGQLDLIHGHASDGERYEAARSKTHSTPTQERRMRCYLSRSDPAVRSVCFDVIKRTIQQLLSAFRARAPWSVNKFGGGING